MNARETLVEASRNTDAQIVRYTFFMGAKDKSNHLTAGYMCCVFFSSCQDPTDGELSLRSATSGETLVE